MPQQAPVARAQTIKQAKAAFNKKGKPALSEREAKQLERSIELERRAWRTREAEKRRAEAAKKKAEKEKKDREENAKAQLGTQRRYDKFGYKSSQMHLGAFLGGGRTMKKMEEKPEQVAETAANDSFGDSGLDDDTLLDAVECVKAVQANNIASPIPETYPNQVPLNTSRVPPTKPQKERTQKPALEDLHDFFDELGSSTQIARELTADEPAPAQRSDPLKALSFSSGDFDLTTEEIEEMEATVLPRKAEQDRRLMPPPPLPLKAAKLQNIKPAVIEHISMQDLECLADYDIQLTQMEPG